MRRDSASRSWGNHHPDGEPSLLQIYQIRIFKKYLAKKAL